MTARADNIYYNFNIKPKEENKAEYLATNTTRTSSCYQSETLLIKKSFA